MGHGKYQVVLIRPQQALYWRPADCIGYHIVRRDAHRFYCRVYITDNVDDIRAASSELGFRLFSAGECQNITCNEIIDAGPRTLSENCHRKRYGLMSAKVEVAKRNGKRICQWVINGRQDLNMGMKERERAPAFGTRQGFGRSAKSRPTST